MATNLEKLRGLLQELFQLDQADLDFGIYRIMNQKRDEVVRFLDKDLLPQVQAAFKHYKSADKLMLETELLEAIVEAKKHFDNPEDSKQVKDLRQKLAGSIVDVTALENEVFSHLFNFFRRYYSEGDFISLRRYKEGVYAIPYEGEEVKLHWANADQYYVKSSETFRDYTFKVAGDKRVRVHLVAASTEQDNNKAAPGMERRFVLADMPLSEENGELFIRFEYRPYDGKEKQDELNKQAIEAVLKTPGFEQWSQELGKLAPTDKRRDRTVLEKHLHQYTARNTFDYFIHKDLGGFLRRELDFYIKNEVMHLDDIEHESAPKVEQYLSQIKVIRSIAHKIIQFLEQLENFQKKLWLKKKFVIETNYCITLDRVPEELYPEIAANEAQRQEWVKLFAIDKMEKDLIGPGYTEPLTVEFLRESKGLFLDSKFFGKPFRDRLLQKFSDLDNQINGLFVCSDNFAALRLLSQRYERKIKSIYIDPPYNTSASEILYKNNYKHSCWLSLIDNTLCLSKKLLNEDTGILCATIDDVEHRVLGELIKQHYGEVTGTVSIRIKPSGRPIPKGFALSHEYALFAKVSSDFPIARLGHTEEQKARYGESDEKGSFFWEIFRKAGSNSNRHNRPTMYYPFYFNKDTQQLRLPSMMYDELRQEYVVLEKISPLEIAIFPIKDDGSEGCWYFGLERAQLLESEFRATLSDSDAVKIYYRRRVNDGQQPSTLWYDSKYSATEHGTALLKEIFGKQEVFDYPKSIHAVIDCLSVSGVKDAKDAVVLDYFAGSGTTAHAVLELNRQDDGDRKFVLVEMGSHHYRVTLPRVLKSAYSSTWSEGIPYERPGGSYTFKYIRLESYEDALNNLELKRSPQQELLLDADAEMREQYTLSYMLDVESRGSQSLLNLESFRNPDEYKLRVERNGETQLVNVDLVETFNWLLGLTVKHIDVIRGVRVVEGTAPNGDRVLVLWRNIDQMDNDALDKWFEKQDYNTREMVYDVFYVNGDNNLENLRRLDQTWKVRLIEEEFKRLMFDVEDV